MNDKRKRWMPILLMAAFAVTRWPGVMPPNFSAAYALAFCAGIYFPRRMAWWLPLLTLFVTDVTMNVFYYQVSPIDDRMAGNYIAYAAMIWFGQRFKPQAAWLSLLAGGVLGALLFYFVTNTISWLVDPGYAKTLPGWIQALTIGKPGWPHTWEFFRNTLLSGGLFTGLFAGAMKLGGATEEEEAQEEDEPAADPAESDQPVADEAKS
ncbi:MAG: DUF6580 family putative transport protein [Verrucomicrobiota bacterium]